MTQTGSNTTARETEPRQRRRLRASAPRVANNNYAGDGLCPVCRGFASIAPVAAEYCGKGLIRRHWLCRTCGHEWVTVLHVLS